MGRARQSDESSRARPCELKEELQCKSSAGARPCELMGRARRSEQSSRARPCELNEELVNVNCWQELVDVN